MPQRSKPIDLRGHHLICIHTFAGKGYSEAFIENMRQIVRASKAPTQTIRIVEGLDHICNFCPHSDRISCLKGDDKIRNMDRKCLTILGVEPGEVYESLQLNSKSEIAINKGLFCAVCTECDWFESHCRAFLCKS